MFYKIKDNFMFKNLMALKNQAKSRLDSMYQSTP